MRSSRKRQQQQNSSHIRPRRENGLSKPYTKAQVGGWIALVATVLEFVLIISPILQLELSIPVTIVFFGSVFSVLYYGTRTIIINPIDIYLYQQLHQQQQEDNNNNNHNEEEEDQQQQQQIHDMPPTNHNNNNNTFDEERCSTTNDEYHNNNNNNNNNTNGNSNHNNNNNNNNNNTTQQEQRATSRNQQQQRTTKTTSSVLSLCYCFYPCMNYNKSNNRNNNNNNNNNNTNNNNNNNNNKNKNRLFFSSNPFHSLSTIPNSEDMKQCWICDTQVATHSMHCKFCNKCVYHFDHHCMWLNTCIGAANYKPFFRTMVSLFIMEFIHFVVQFVLIIDLFVHFGSTKDLAYNWFGIDDIKSPVDIIFNAIMIFFVCFNVISMILLGQLINFHIGLQKQKITTYEFIVLDSKRKREENKLMGDLERNRVYEMEKAQSVNNHWRVYHLQFGKFCRSTLNCGYCDPLEIPKPYEPDIDAGFSSALGNHFVTPTSSPIPPPPTSSTVPTTTRTTTSPQPQLSSSDHNNYTITMSDDDDILTSTNHHDFITKTIPVSNGSIMNESQNDNNNNDAVSKSLEQTETIASNHDATLPTHDTTNTNTSTILLAEDNSMEHQYLQRPATPDLYFR